MGRQAIQIRKIGGNKYKKLAILGSEADRSGLDNSMVSSDLGRPRSPYKSQTKMHVCGFSYFHLELLRNFRDILKIFLIKFCTKKKFHTFFYIIVVLKPQAPKTILYQSTFFMPNKRVSHARSYAHARAWCFRLSSVMTENNRVQPSMTENNRALPTMTEHDWARARSFSNTYIPSDK